MIDRLGVTGVIGLLVLLGGIALVAWENLVVAAGIALVIAGLGLVLHGLVKNALIAMGMGGML